MALDERGVLWWHKTRPRTRRPLDERPHATISPIPPARACHRLSHNFLSRGVNDGKRGPPRCCVPEQVDDGGPGRQPVERGFMPRARSLSQYRPICGAGIHPPLGLDRRHEVGTAGTAACGRNPGAQTLGYVDVVLPLESAQSPQGRPHVQDGARGPDLPPVEYANWRKGVEEVLHVLDELPDRQVPLWQLVEVVEVAGLCGLR